MLPTWQKDLINIHHLSDEIDQQCLRFADYIHGPSTNETRQQKLQVTQIAGPTVSPRDFIFEQVSPFVPKLKSPNCIAKVFGLWMDYIYAAERADIVRRSSDSTSSERV